MADRRQPARGGLGNPTRRAILQFALSGLAALIVFSVLAGFVLRHQGRDEAVRESRVLAAALARGVIQPALDDGLLHGERASIARIDKAVRNGILGDSVFRVKLWTRGGTIVYSDEPRLVGATYALESEQLETLSSGEVVAEVSDLAGAENRFERGSGRLLEVYQRVTTPGGEPLLFETYQPLASVSARGESLWLRFAPAALGALLLLWLVQLPLAASLARHLRDTRREREARLEQLVDASERERARIAADLHDGVVQDLAGIAFSLGADADRLPDEEPLRGRLHEAASATRTALRRLRSLIVEIYPPNLESVGLVPALADLIAPVERHGVAVAVNVPEQRLSPRAEQVIYRAAQEALRNVTRHARARHIVVEITTHEGRARLVVEDDGVGIENQVTDAARTNGHVGLRLLRDTADVSGGTFDVTPVRPQGTRVTMEIPE